jgi:hypothetical protein
MRWRPPRRWDFEQGVGRDGGRRRDLKQDGDDSEHSAGPCLDDDDGEARRGTKEALGGRCGGWVNG